MAFKSNFSLLLLIVLVTGCKNDNDNFLPYTPPFLEIQDQFIDSLIQSMRIEDKIGQLLVLKSEKWDNEKSNACLRWVKEGIVGGLILNQLPLINFINTVDSANQLSNIPLFIGSEEQFLVNNQFSDISRIPDAYTFFALPNDTLKDRLKELFVKQMLVLGINFSISPKLDEILPSGGITPTDYFKVNPTVSPMLSLVKPMRENGILSIGNQISVNRLFSSSNALSLDSLMYPYREFIRVGISGFKMDPSLFDRSPLVKNEISSLLRTQLEFEGLAVAEVESDRLMEETVLGGSDVIIVRENPQQLFDYIKSALQQGFLSMDDIDRRLKRVLKAKTWMYKGIDIKKLEDRFSEKWRKKASEGSIAQLDRFKSFTKFQIHQHFTNKSWGALNRRIYENSIILASNYNNTLPFSNIYRKNFKVFQFFEDIAPESFQRYFSNYASKFTPYNIAVRKGDSFPELYDSGDDGTYVILLNEVYLRAEKDTSFLKSLNEIVKNREVVVINIGDYNNLAVFDKNFTLIQVFERTDLTESLAAQMLFGALSAKGILPFDVNNYFRAEQGSNISGFRLKFAQAEEVGISPEKLASIDAIANSAVDAEATPGCQVLVAKDGRIIYSKSFGYHAYGSDVRVRNEDIYDIASVTKIAATTLAVMKLYDENRIKLNDRLKEYVPIDERAEIGNIKIKNLLTHESGLQPNMPISRFALGRDSTRIRNKFFSLINEEPYTIQVADSFFFNRYYLDSIWLDVQTLAIKRAQGYRYSDVNFVLLQKVVESITQVPLDSFVNETFYRPMGLTHTMFKPKSKFDTTYIVPTEYDERWRKQTIHGYPHDETAAILGGVSGNAGLFSNAEELAVIGQLLLNKGTYGGRPYLKPKTVEYFSSNRHGNHRGLGFDKPYTGRLSSVAEAASELTYGHTGFTGTCIWIDPAYNLVYVFLSNRVHPSRSNFKLIQLQVRERIQKVIYDALNTYQAQVPDLDFDLDLN